MWHYNSQFKHYIGEAVIWICIYNVDGVNPLKEIYLRHKETFQKIGLRIQYFRKKQNLSQAELAKRIGISMSYISKIERADIDSFAVITLLV